MMVKTAVKLHRFLTHFELRNNGVRFNAKDLSVIVVNNPFLQSFSVYNNCIDDPDYICLNTAIINHKRLSEIKISIFIINS